MPANLQEQIRIEKNAMLDYALVVFSIVTVFALFTSLSRIFTLGMLPVFWVQIFIASSIFLITAFRKKISFSFKLTFFLLINMILGIQGILAFGMAGGAIIFMIQTSILATTLLNLRAGIFFLTGTALFLMITGALVVSGLWQFSVDSKAFTLSYSTWLVYIVSITGFNLLAILIIEKMNQINMKQLELLEIQRQELEQANGTKNKLFRLIAHDLRSPFQGMINALEIFTEDIDALKPAERQRFFQAILRDSVRSYSMLESLLIWSRNQIGDLQIQMRSLEAEPLINECMGIHLRLARAKQINIKVNVSKGTVVYADQHSLKIVLCNLISNAIKFTKIDGEIIISARITDNKTIITVSDNGVGMSNEVLANLLEPGSQYTSTGTLNETGTGLGLRICQDLLIANMGELKIKSTQNEGSEFFVILNSFPVHKNIKTQNEIL